MLWPIAQFIKFILLQRPKIMSTTKKLLNLFGYFLLFLLYYFLFSWILYMLKMFNVLTPDQIRLVELFVFPIIFIRVMYKYLRHVDLNQVKNIKANFWSTPISLLTTILLFILYAILWIFMSEIFMYYSPNFYEKYLIEVQDQENRLQLLYKDLSFKPSLMILIADQCILPALYEEFFFRGILQNIFLTKIKKPFLSIAFSALLFSAIHFMPYAMIYLFLKGLLYGTIYYTTDSLLLPILGHLLNNITCILVKNYPDIYEATEKQIEACLSVPFCIAGIVICLYLGCLGFKVLKLYKKGTIVDAL